MAILLGLTAGLGAMAPGAERVPLPVTAPVMRRSRRSIMRSQSSSITWGYLKHPPSTNARERRAATKAKNRAKHRAHMKGRA
jgi:hypothetical protein